MSSGDTNQAPVPKHMTYSKSKVPIIGALIDYIELSVDYLLGKSINNSDQLNPKFSKSNLSAGFLTVICFLLGLISNVKFEVVTLDESPLPKDLHFMLMSSDDNIYMEDIDVNRVMWCVEASDATVLVICCILIFYSAFVKSPLSEYLFLPWMGLTVRGLFLRQAPTVSALLYTMAVINGTINTVFLTVFSFLFLLEARIWFEIARVIRSRWERRNNFNSRQNDFYEVETLWSNDDVQSVEVQNYVY